MKLSACKQCAAPVARWLDAGIRRQADLTALTPTAHAQAWINGQTVYKVNTLTISQWATRQWSSPINVAALVEQLQDGTPARHTYLLAHHCPGPLVCIDQVMTTWQPADAAAFLPAPRLAPTYEGMPF
jgi:hypothetical protein